MLTNFISEAARQMTKTTAEAAKTEFRIEKGDGSIRVNRKRPIPTPSTDIYDRARVIYLRARRPHLSRALSIF